MNAAILIAVYLLVIAALGWGESKLLMALKLGNRWGGMVYAVVGNLICAAVAPVAAVASVAAGFIGVFSAINNTKGITGQEAFNSFALPIAIIALGLIVVVRILPLLLMNLRSPLKALLYSVASTVLLSVLFTISGIAMMVAISDSSPKTSTPPVATPSPTASPTTHE